MEERKTLYHVEDVGRLLLSVEEELKTLRTKLRDERNPRAGGDGGAEALLRKAEAELRAKAKIVLNAVTQNSISTLPTLPSINRQEEETVRKSRAPVYRESDVNLPEYPPQGSSGGNAARDLANIQRAGKSGDVGKMMFRDKYGINIVKKPEEKTRHAKRRIVQAQRRKVAAPSRRRGPTVRGKPLPVENRRDDKNAPSVPLTERDISKGMISLVNRGILPKSADLTLAFSRGPAPLIAGGVKYHDWNSRHDKPTHRASTAGQNSGFNIHSAKLDVSSDVSWNGMSRRGTKSSRNLQRSRMGNVVALGEDELIENRNQEEEDDVFHTQSVEDEQRNFADDMNRIRGYNELLDKHSLHQFIIRKGKVLETTPEFLSFKRKHAVLWGPVVSIIRQLEKFLGSYAVPMAYIDGRHVVELAKDELTLPSKDDLLMCIENIDEVHPLLQIPGRRYMGEMGREAAAIKLQSKYRQHYETHKFKHGRRQRHGCDIIVNFMKMMVQRKRCVETLQIRAKTREEEWRKLQSDFHRDWDEIKTKRRVVVHVPSLSVSEFQRMTIPQLLLQQSTQLSRIFEIADPQVDIVYVAAFKAKENIRQYFEKLLIVGGIRNPNARFRVVIPENIGRFHPHISLTTALLYSPRTMKRIKNFCGNKSSYIVPRIVSNEEKKLALALRMPILGTDPNLSALYSSASGCKAVFASSQVLMPPGVHDVYDVDELLLTLSKLIAAQPLTERWVVKLNHEIDGRGHAVLEPRDLNCIFQIRYEQRKNLNNEGYWGRLEVQQRVQTLLKAELESKLSILLKRCAPEVYTSYDEYIRSMNEFGAAIEAEPAGVVGHTSTNLFIEPSGAVHVMSSHELIFSKGYQAFHKLLLVGMSVFPQQSVSHRAIYDVSKVVGKELHRRRVYGYVEVFYTAFTKTIEKKKEGSVIRLWATGLELGFTRSNASFATFNFLMKGQFDAIGGKYLIKGNENGEETNRPGTASTGQTTITGREAGIGAKVASDPWERRAYVSVDFLHHACLSAARYSNFFNLCRLHGISYDLQARIGSVFSLYDSLTCGVIGLLCIAPLRRHAVRSMRDAFSFIRRQVGGGRPKTEFEEGTTNFGEIQFAVRKMLSDYKRREQEKLGNSLNAEK
eukprot:g844.t1